MHRTIRTGQIGPIKPMNKVDADIEQLEFDSFNAAHEYFYSQTEYLRANFEAYSFEIWGPGESFKPVFSHGWYRIR
jgi:hypothetical protein